MRLVRNYTPLSDLGLFRARQVRTARNLAAPATVVLGQITFTYYSCDSTKPTDGYDEVSIDVSTNKTVMCVSALVKCKDETESKRRRDEIAAKLKAEFADHISEDSKTAPRSVVREGLRGRRAHDVRLQEDDRREQPTRGRQKEGQMTSGKECINSCHLPMGCQ